MRRTILVLTLVGAMLLACTSAVLAQQSTQKGDSASAEANVEEEAVAGEILVKFEDVVASQAQAQIHEENGGEVIETIPGIDVDVVEVPEGEEEEKVAEYEADPNVEYAELNGTWRALDDGPEAEFTPNDPQINNQWQFNNTGQTGGTNNADIDAFEAWDVTRGSSSAKIAILDTGIDQSHEDLASKIVLQQDFTGSASGVEDNQGHGTHVSGSATAKSNNSIGVGGTCHDCALMNGKVLNDSGSGSFDGVANGIVWAVDNDADVVSMSLGGSGGSQTAEDAVDYAWDEGAVVVAAAGNSNTSSPSYPAFYENAIAVGSTDHSDTKSSFSNFGAWVDVAAPGSSILSTAPDHPSGIFGSPGPKYGTISGTSMATPHVAGVAGLVFSNQGQCSDNTCVRQKIESSIVDRSVLNNTGAISWANARINADKAVGGGTDPGAPTIASSTPTPGQQKVARTTNVVANFSEEMDKSTLTTNNVQLYLNGSGSPIPATVTPSVDGKSVTLDPSSNLKGFKVYQVRMYKDSSGIKDLQGNPLAAGGNYQDGGDYVYWSFKTWFF